MITASYLKILFEGKWKTYIHHPNMFKKQASVLDLAKVKIRDITIEIVKSFKLMNQN